MNGLYQVSNLGRVKSLPRNWLKQEKIWNGSTSSFHKYYQITLSKNNKYKNYRVHRLVAETFLDKTNFKYWHTEDPTKIDLNKLEVNHIDFNPRNNRVDNLEWCTSLYNCNHKKNSKPLGE